MAESNPEKVAWQWINHARRDWRDAQILAAADSKSGNLMWMIQQAAEKSIKAILIREGVVFRRIHDLEKLVDLLPGKHVLLEERNRLELLSLRAMQSRYPGEYIETEAADCELALAVGRRVFEIMKDEFPVVDESET